MSEEKKNEVLEQNELNESELDGVAGGMATGNPMGMNKFSSNARVKEDGTDGVAKNGRMIW